MTFSAILMLPAVSAINGWPVGHINPPFVKWIHHPNKFQTRTENGKTLDLNYLPRRFLRPCSLSLSRFLGSMIGRTRFKKKSTTFYNFSEGPLGLGRHRRHLHCKFSWIGLWGQHRCWSNQWLRPRRLGWCVPRALFTAGIFQQHGGGICSGYLRRYMFSRLPYFNILSRFPKSWGEPQIIQSSWMTILVLNHAGFEDPPFSVHRLFCYPSGRCNQKIETCSTRFYNQWMMDSTGYPLVMTNSLLLKMAIVK